MNERKKTAFKKLGLIVSTLLLLSAIYSFIPQAIAQGFDDDEGSEDEEGVFCCLGLFFAFYAAITVISIALPLLIGLAFLAGLILCIVLIIKIINKINSK